jgi:hypothetical protein
MEKRTVQLNRRRFLSLGAISTLMVAGLTKMGLGGQSVAWAQGACAPKPEPAGKKIADASKPGMPKTANYVIDATTSKDSKYVKGANCENCQFYKLDPKTPGWAPCQMLGNQFVSACGWCKLYKKNPKLA